MLGKQYLKAWDLSKMRLLGVLCMHVFFFFKVFRKMLTTQSGEKHAPDKWIIVKIKKVEGALSFVTLKNHRLSLQARKKEVNFKY